MGSSTVIDAPPQFEVGQEVHSYYVSDSTVSSGGLLCSHTVGTIIEVDGEQMVKTKYGHIVPLGKEWRGTMHDAAMDASAKIGKVINGLHKQIGELLEGSAGK